MIQRLHALLEEQQYQGFCDALGHAEIAGDISEFHVLRFRAMLAMFEESGHAADYLEMAETVAVTSWERAIILETMAAHDLLRGDPQTAAERCLTLLDRVGHTHGIWVLLLIALRHLGAMAQVDEMLCRVARLNEEWARRLAALLGSGPSQCVMAAHAVGIRVSG